MRPTASEALALRTSEVTYPGAAKHIRAVRADLRPLLADCPMADDVILCASELAANATRHSNSRLPGGAFTVRVVISPCDHVRIEVEDNGGLWNPAVSDSDRHHGLDIISILATDWGIDGDQASRTAWARFDWPAPS
jgi:anti-sigma regulatory factor (Ser/Thr protein kinase)